MRYNYRIEDLEKHDPIGMIGKLLFREDQVNLGGHINSLVDYAVGYNQKEGFIIDLGTSYQIALVESYVPQNGDYAFVEIYDKYVKRISYDQFSGIYDQGLLLTFTDDTHGYIDLQTHGDYYFMAIVNDELTGPAYNEGWDHGYGEGLREGLEQAQQNKEHYGIYYNGQWLTAEQYGEMRYAAGYGEQDVNVFTMIIGAIWSFMTAIGMLEILPGFKIIYIVGISLVFGLVLFITGRGKGD